MKISEVKRIIRGLERLSMNLEKLYALSTGVMTYGPDKDMARDWCEKIADMATVDSPLSAVFQEARNVANIEITRLNELIDNTDIDPYEYTGE